VTRSDGTAADRDESVRIGLTDDPNEIAAVQYKNPIPEGVPSQSLITATEYATFQNAFNYFDKSLFAGALPEPLITLQRKARTYGFFLRKSFRRRGNSIEHVHEIVLNPDGFVGRSDEKILSTLVHEMSHIWQAEFGHGGRGHYHNREWGAKMHSIGLMPSATGLPGGAKTGDHMSHYILEGGPFEIACREFLERYRLTWESATAPAEAPTEGGDGAAPDGSEDGSTSAGVENVKKPQTRAKFVCPIPGCKETALAKPSARIACLTHTTELGEPIPLVRVEAMEQETKRASHDTR